MKRISDGKYEKRQILLVNLVSTFIVLFLLFIFLIVPLSQKLFVKNTDVIITNKGLNNKNAKGSEIWLQRLNINGKDVDINKYIINNIGWSQKDNAYISTGDINKEQTLTLKFNEPKSIKLYFLSHEWSGIVHIKQNNHSKYIDLYNIKGDSIDYVVKNLSIYMILFNIISVIILFPLVYWLILLISIKIIKYKSNKVLFIFNNKIFWIIIVCIFFRVFYFRFIEIYTLFPDSVDYLNYTMLNTLRTPLYPLFIKVIRFFTGEKYLYYGIVFGQVIISLVSIGCMYISLIHLQKSKIIAITGTIIYGCLPGIVNYETCILSESLTLSFLVIFIMILAIYLSKPSIIKSFSINIFAFLLVMIRPSNIIIGILLFAFWVLRAIFNKQTRKYELIGFLGFIFYVLALVLYSLLLYKHTNFFGISNAGELNKLITIIMNNLYFNNNYKTYQDFIIDQKAIANNEPWTIYGKFIDEFLYVEDGYKKVNLYISNCFKVNFYEYLDYIKSTTLNILPTQIVSVYATMKVPIVSSIINNLLFPITFFHGIILTFIYFVYGIINWIKSKSIPWVVMGLSGMLVGFFITGIYGSPIEIQRHSINVIPLLIITLCILISVCIDYYKKNNDKAIMVK